MHKDSRYAMSFKELNELLLKEIKNQFPEEKGDIITDTTWVPTKAEGAELIITIREKM